MSELQNKFDQLINEQRELQKKFQETAQSLFKETMKEFWEKNPGVSAVVWTQYTPYFNDGETCEFGVNDPCFTNAPDPENINWGEYEGEEENVWALESYVLTSDREYYVEEQKLALSSGNVDAASCSLLSKMICSGELEDVMEAMFGNHVKVIATRDGFDIEDFNHD